MIYCRPKLSAGNTSNLNRISCLKLPILLYYTFFQVIIHASNYSGIKNIDQNTFLLRSVPTLMLIKMRNGTFSLFDLADFFCMFLVVFFFLIDLLYG